MILSSMKRNQSKKTSKLFPNPLEFIPNEPVLRYLDPNSNNRALIVSDLHLGFEVALRERGINIPSQYETILQRLVSLIKRERINVVYIVGDLKHSTVNITSSEWYQIPKFLEALSQIVGIHIIKGNHDGDLQEMCPPDVRIYPASGIKLPSKLGPILLLHGHAWPKIDDLDSTIIVTGHIHPTVKFQESIRKRSRKLPIWIVGRWNPYVLRNQIPLKKEDRERLVILSNGYSSSAARASNL